MRSLKSAFAPLATAMAIAFVAAPATAAVVITVNEVGSDVVFAISGSLNLTGAVSTGAYPNYGLGFISGGSNWYIAAGSGATVTGYEFTTFDGPFGTSGTYFSSPTSSTGDDFFMWGQGGATEQLGVDANYISGASITSGLVFANATLASLTLTTGTYNYAIPSDTVTLIIGGGRGTVPEPGSLALTGLALAGLAAAARKRSQGTV